MTLGGQWLDEGSPESHMLAQYEGGLVYLHKITSVCSKGVGRALEAIFILFFDIALILIMVIVYVTWRLTALRKRHTRG